jgi:cellulose synthase/poly-beta-1,6-N-acetylglucosamine synthase-like glycosyltransferase
MTALFVMAVILFLYPLMVYPLIIALLARLFPNPVEKSRGPHLPPVTFIIPAFNEEAV